MLGDKLDEQVKRVDDPALRVGGEDALGAEVAGVDPGGALVDEFARLTDELGVAFQDDGTSGAVRLHYIHGHRKGGVVLQLGDLAGVGKGADPEGAAVPTVPDGDHMWGAGGISGSEAGDVRCGEESFNGGREGEKDSSHRSIPFQPNWICVLWDPIIRLSKGNRFCSTDCGSDS